MKTCEIDISSIAREDVKNIDLSNVHIAQVYITLWSVGVTNDHRDICEDYVEASWAAEKLAAAAGHAEVTEEYLREGNKTRLKITLTNLKPLFVESLSEVLVYFGAWRVDGSDQTEEFKAVQKAVLDYEESLPPPNPALPELIDGYFANLINGAYYQIRADMPDIYREQIGKHPERELGFYKSAYSGRLGGNCYPGARVVWYIQAAHFLC
ncbi:hypothetical protein [Reyranella sp.]|jgi:hypothetical protein|uniref:hypothetical protein n=1 Tax=Reyranella sp. TaxID=1929291 RepID=UPI00260BFB29|nr:hypothetical protein [Reyranella sp.]HQS18690.1 hypothetical protein [Reyranella sp.]HQT15186.1 hypothetical protein [Reyranella sp.]